MKKILSILIFLLMINLVFGEVAVVDTTSNQQVNDEIYTPASWWQNIAGMFAFVSSGGTAPSGWTCNTYVSQTQFTSKYETVQVGNYCPANAKVDLFLCYNNDCGNVIKQATGYKVGGVSPTFSGFAVGANYIYRCYSCNVAPPTPSDSSTPAPTRCYTPPNNIDQYCGTDNMVYIWNSYYCKYVNFQESCGKSVCTDFKYYCDAGTSIKENACGTITTLATCSCDVNNPVTSSSTKVSDINMLKTRWCNVDCDTNQNYRCVGNTLYDICLRPRADCTKFGVNGRCEVLADGAQCTRDVEPPSVTCCKCTSNGQAFCIDSQTSYPNCPSGYVQKTLSASDCTVPNPSPTVTPVPSPISKTKLIMIFVIIVIIIILLAIAVSLSMMMKRR